MLQSARQVVSMSIGLAAWLLASGAGQSLAQMSGPAMARSLGGYGAATISSYYSSGGGGYVPYNGNASGFVPYRGGGGGIGTQPIPRRVPSTPIGGGSLGMGMGAGSRGAMGRTSRTSGRIAVPFGYEGGLGMSGMSGAMAGARSQSRPSGPGLGYPFRMPPPVTGPSMAMP